MTPLIFAGSPDFAVEHLEYLHKVKGCDIRLVLTAADKIAGRGKNLRSTPVKNYALKEGLRVLETSDIKDPKVLSQIIDVEADFMVVVAYGFILPPEILSSVTCVNVHASILPAWRGAAPVERSIMAGDQKTGVTLIKMSQKLDGGDIISCEGLDIDPIDNRETLKSKLSRIGCKLLGEFIDNPKMIESAKPQGSANYPYATKVKSEEFRLNLSDSSLMNYRKVKAFYPEAYLIINKKICKILDAKLTNGAGDNLANLVVEMKDGYLEVLKLRSSSGKVMGGKSFICGLRGVKPLVE